jgi:sortase A
MPGHIGNVVIGGHRTTKDRPFRDIDQLLPGDEVILSTLEGRFVYKVNRTEIVTPDSMWIIDQTPAFTATLFACHPVGSTRERIIVFLDLDDNA